MNTVYCVIVMDLDSKDETNSKHMVQLIFDNEEAATECMLYYKLKGHVVSNVGIIDVRHKFNLEEKE